MPLFCKASAQGEQVSKSFFNCLPKVSKSQIIFSTVCSSWADFKLFSWPFAQAEQVSILFFGVCSRWAGIQFYFLRFAQAEQVLQFIFWGLLKLSRHPILFFEVCSSGMVGAVPVCPPERPRSGVSILKIHALCARNLTMDAPLRGALAGTQARPLPLLLHHFSLFFPRLIICHWTHCQSFWANGEGYRSHGWLAEAHAKTVGVIRWDCRPISAAVIRSINRITTAVTRACSGEKDSRRSARGVGLGIEVPTCVPTIGWSINSTTTPILGKASKCFTCRQMKTSWTGVVDGFDNCIIWPVADLGIVGRPSVDISSVAPIPSSVTIWEANRLVGILNSITVSATSIIATIIERESCGTGRCATVAIIDSIGTR